MRYLIALLLFASPAVAGEPAYSWRPNANDPDRTYLYLDGKQVGGWCYSSKHYRTFDGKEWGPPTATAPSKPPAQRAVVITTPKVVMAPPSYPTPRMRGGPLKVRLGTAMADVITDTTMKMVEEIPGAIWDSIKKGNVKLGKVEGKIEIK